MSNKKLSTEEWIILVLEISVIIAGIIITYIKFSEDWKFLSYIGIPCALISISMLLIAFQIKEKHRNIARSLSNEREKATILYNKLDNYLTLDELNDVERKFGIADKGTNTRIYIISNDLSTEEEGWGKIIEENLRSNVKYFYFTTEKNKDFFNGVFQDLKNKRGLKDKNLQDNISVCLNNCFFKFMPEFCEVVIYDNVGSSHSSKRPNGRECYVCYANNGEKILYKKVDNAACNNILDIINGCLNNSPNNNCTSCTHTSRWGKYTN